MARAKLKLSPAISDRTVKDDGGSVEEGMEAVLFHNKERRERHRRSSNKSANDGGLGNDEASAVFELPQHTELLDLVEREKWESLMYRILKEPHTAHVKFTGRSTNSPSADNLVLHEACKQNPPLDLVEALIEANAMAVMVKGNSGYLPIHYACAHGASIELIRFLLSIYPEGLRVVDEDEGFLPLHLACIYGNTEEDVYMYLLTLYPEGSMIRDDFGRRPIDYAKSIRNDSQRRIAVECLKRAKWLEIAAMDSKERTERDFHRKIKGYEEAQAQHLKMLEDVHTKEIIDLETNLDSQTVKLAERSKEMKELDLHLQEITDKFHERIESLEKTMNTKTRKLQGQIEKAKEETKKTKKALDAKSGEYDKLTQKLTKTKEINNSLSRQLEERTEELDLALEDIETLNKHTEWLESILGSIRNLTNSESPSIRDTERNGDVVSVRSKKTDKLSSGASSRISKASPEQLDEARQPTSLMSRLIGSRRE
mmetsp:Transcript_13310/g.31341  ORF Transcript_13310/g.31341 Transcript_13310/m.31341 type:complete len:484 (-) Transcript_13310:117-1568(-)